MVPRIRVFAENVVGLVSCSLFPRKTYLLWEKVVQMPLLASNFSWVEFSWVGSWSVP